jgi:hypothetical protein
MHEHLRRHHYLGLHVVGENLKYLVQTHDGQDVACLLFGAAAWQSAARDKFIGWTAVQRAQGLSQVVNNTRFLVLPWVKVPGLASHVLSRAVRRLGGDWQRKYGHPVWLVETFVDRDRFAGTAYRAAKGSPIGTGAMESTCGQLQTRVKRTGQFWKPAGLANLLALKAALQNDDWLALWSRN